MKTCNDILEQRYLFLDGELSPSDAERVAEHLETCAPCAARFEGERVLLELVASTGIEEAPPELRERVRRLLADEVATTDRGRRSARRAILERLAVPLAAAAVLALVLFQPTRRVAPIADRFASDHIQHALIWPSINPFPVTAPVPDPPALAGSEVEGLSRCVIDGRTYAHYIYEVKGERVSAYLPLDAMPPPTIGTASVGAVTIISVDAHAGLPGAVLASDDLSSRDLTRVWSRS